MTAARLVIGGVIVLAAFGGTPHASAACHAFSIAVSPSTVDEGDPVTVTVSRDGNAGPSRVHVRTVAGSAQAPQDYDALVKRAVVFGSEISRSFTLATRNDASTEGDESFSLHLFDGDGCPPNPRFRYGTDAAVTIRSNDAATTEPATPASPAATTTATPVVTPTPAGEEGLSTGAVVGIALGAIAVLAVIAGIAFSWGRRRRPPASPAS